MFYTLMRPHLPRLRWAVAAVVGSLAACPSIAAGAVLHTERARPPEGQPIFLIEVAPVGGELNTMSVSVASGGVVVRDASAPLRLGDAGCVLVSQHEARCAVAGQVTLRGSLGDGDDSLLVTGAAASMNGGEGDDRLALAGFAGSLDGGPGADVLEGGPGPDQLMGGDGPDVLRGAGGGDYLHPDGLTPDHDRIDGGPGRDTVMYSRPRGRRIDLRGRFPTAGAEREASQAVEVVFASDGDDVVLGSGQRESIFSGAGNDVVRAGAGNDYVDSGVGRDRVAAGRGDDVVNPGTHFPYFPGDAKLPPADAVGCGSGRDRVERVTLMDRLAPDCEYLSDRVLDDDLRARPRPARTRARPVGVGRRSLTFRLPCDRSGRTACRGTLDIRSARGRSLGRQAFRIEPRRARNIRVRLNAAGRRLLGRRSGATVRIQAAYRTGRALETLDDPSWSTSLRARTSR